MRLRVLTLRDFRNIPAAEVGLDGLRHFFVGPNGQGKTNLLEAAGCLTALRSFRTAESAALIRAGCAEAGIGAALEHEHRGDTRLRLLFRRDGKEVWADEERVRRLADHLGAFPVVAFSSQDLQLVRGAPALRRRWLDLTLAAMDAGYLVALQAYTKALAGRNRLLKAGAADGAQLAAFEQVMAPAAAELGRQRVQGIAALAATAGSQYAAMAGEEAANVHYQAAGDVQDASAWLKLWMDGRRQDERLRSTSAGPHRDDLQLTIKDHSARDFGSEGQQRSLVLALRLAQVAWFAQRSRTRPVILADDVLGELDPDRRRRFWAALDPASQVLATGTALPDPELGAWQIFRVEAGQFRPA